jgi:hypothetical protein
MPISELQREVATIALRTAARHGFALAGGNALIAHGVIDRPTDDVDLFSDQETGVAAAADAVEGALHEAGFLTERLDSIGELEDIFEGAAEGIAEWIITAPGGQQTMLQMAYFDRTRGPVTMDVGPVLDLDDLAGWKLVALLNRAEPRDYIDTAAALEHYTIGQLISFAKRLDPGLEDRDFADAGQRLDRMPDRVFAVYKLSQQDIALLRERFADWPRPGHAIWHDQGGSGVLSGTDPPDHGLASASAAVAGQRDQRLSQSEVLAGAQVAHGPDPERGGQVLGVALADPGKRRYRRVHKLVQAVALVCLVKDLIQHYTNRHGQSLPVGADSAGVSRPVLVQTYTTRRVPP